MRSGIIIIYHCVLGRRSIERSGVDQGIPFKGILGDNTPRKDPKEPMTRVLVLQDKPSKQVRQYTFTDEAKSKEVELAC